MGTVFFPANGGVDRLDPATGLVTEWHVPGLPTTEIDIDFAPRDIALDPELVDTAVLSQGQGDQLISAASAVVPGCARVNN